MIVAVAPKDRAPPPVLTCTVNRSHWETSKVRLGSDFAQQFGGVTVTVTGVALNALLQPLLKDFTKIVAVVVFDGVTRVLKTKLAIFAFCGMTIEFLLSSLEAFPSPRNWVFGIDWSVAK